MALRTAFTDLLSLQHPIALAPMGGASGGALAAAVSNGGGLGLVGGARADSGWLAREVAIATESTGKPWGVGFQTWATGPAMIEHALAHRPSAIMLSFGDPGPLAGLVRRAGVVLIIQVTDLDEARQAMDAGADVIVAQGTEAGGHGGRRSTLPFVPVVADGGIADGRGLAAALALGAAGALLGTRFLATPEALVPPSVTKAIIESGGEDTERSRVSDIAREAPWPAKYPARTLRTPFFDQRRGREGELAADPGARQAYREAVAHGDLPPDPAWASEAIDHITEISPAADLVGTLAAQAEEALARAAGRLPVGSGRLAVGARVNLELGGFDREPYLAAGAERQLCDGRGCDVYQGGWLSFEVDPDPVSEHGQAGYLRGPGVASAAGLRELAADHHGGRADGDEHVAVQALDGDDEGPAAGKSHPGAVGPAGVEVEADEFRDVRGGGLAGDLSRGALLDDAPCFEDDELVSEHERFERVVRDQQAWAGEICQVFPEFGLHVKAGSCVQRRQGLVQ